MPFIDQTRKQFRCPCCGKIARPDKFLEGADGKHALQYALQESLSAPGRRGGFRWTFGSMSRDEVAVLREVLQLAANRLTAVLDAVDRAERGEDVAGALAIEIASTRNRQERERLERLAADVAEILKEE